MSQNGSSRAGSSRAGSATSAMSGIASVAATRRQAFLMFLPLERSTERFAFYMRHAVEYLQLLGLVVNTNFQWDNLIGKIFAYVLYGTTLPFWDKGWVGDLDIVSLILIWVAVALLLIPPTAIAVNIVRDAQHLPAALNASVSWIVHAFGTWLFIPTLHAFTNFFVCDSQRVNLFWHNSYSCTGGVAGVYFAGGVVGIILLFICAHVANSLAFEDTWQSNKISARSRPYLLEVTAFFKLALVLCYHVLLSKNLPQAFAITGLCILLALSAVVAFMQPYYSPVVSNVLCGFTLSAALVHAAAIVGVYTSSAASGGASFALFFAPLVVGFGVGLALPSIRRNRQLANDLDVARKGGLVEYTDYLFPAGLPNSDVCFSQFKNIEQDIISAAAATRESLALERARTRQERRDEGASDEGSDSEDDTAPVIAAPFINRVWCASDVELASRTLREYSVALEMKPTDFMIAFVCRIFTKGLLLFPHDGALAVDFHHFLYNFAFLPRLALSESEIVTRGEASLTTQYRAMKLQLKLKSVLNITDQQHTRTVKAALRLHKEVLGHMTIFWSKLLADKVDIVQLASVVNSITQRRASAQTQFAKALRFATRSTLTKYARFLEQVMHDTTSATQLSQYIADQEAERRNNKKGADGGSQQGSAAMSDIASGIISKIDSNVQVNSERDRSTNIARLSAVMHWLVFGLLVIIGLFFGYEAVRLTFMNQTIDRTSAATDLRLMAAQGAFLSEEVLVTVDRLREASRVASGQASTVNPGLIADATTQQMLNTRLSTLQSTLAALGAQFTSTHNSLTTGNLESSYGPLQDFLQQSRVESLEDSTYTTAIRTATDLKNLGGRIGAAMTTVGTAVLFNGTDVQRAAALLLRNSIDNYAAALNRTIALHRDEANNWTEAMRWVLLGLTSLAALALFVVYCTMVLNFASIGVAKLSIIGLFALIPRVHLERLQQQARDRIAQFDVDDQPDTEAGLLPGRVEEKHNTSRTENISTAVLRKPTKLTPVESTTLAMWDRGGSLEAGDANDARVGLSDADHDHDAGAEDGDASESHRGNKATALSSKRAARSSNQEHESAVRLASGLAALSLLMLSLLIASFALTVQGARAASDLSNRMESERQAILREDVADTRLRRLTDLAQGFVLSGDVNQLSDYATEYADAISYRYAAELTASEPTEALVASVVAVHQIEDFMLLRQHVALWLASQGYQAGQSVVASIVQNLEYNNTLLSAVQQSTFAEFQVAGVTNMETVYPSSDNVIDATLPNGQQVLVAKALALDTNYNAFFVLLERARGDRRGYVAGKISDLYDQVEQYFPAAIGLFGGALFFGIFAAGLAFELSSRDPSSRTALRIMMVVVIFSMCFLAANIGVLGYTLWAASETHSKYRDSYDQSARTNMSRAAIYDPIRYARSFASFGKQQFVTSYQTELRNADIRAALISTLEGPFVAHMSDDEVRDLSNAISAAVAAANDLMAMSDIGLRLAGAGYGFLASVSSLADLSALVYDRSRQRGESYASIAYGFEAATEYTTNTQDDALPAATQVSRSASTLTNLRFQDVAWRAQQAVENVGTIMDNALNSYVEWLLQNVETFTLTVKACTGCAMGLLFIVSMYAGYAAISRAMTGKNTTNANGTGKSDSQEELLFGTLTRRVQFTLVVLALSFLTLFAYDLYTLEVVARKGVQIDAESSRAWNVARSGLMSQEALRYTFATVSTLPDATSHPGASRKRLTLTASQILYERNALYGDRDWPSDSSRTNLFGQIDATSSMRLKADCDLAVTHAAAFASNTVPGNAYASQWTADDVDALHLQWVRTIVSIATSAPLDSNSTAAQYAASVALRDEIVRLEIAAVQALTNSSDSMLSQLRTSATTESTVHFALSAAVTALLFLVLLFVFRPMVDRLLFEDDGTRLLLRMIPESVRNDVPAIAEYLEHGTVTQNEKLQRISEVVSELSTVAYIVMDQFGIILRASRAACDEFGHEPEAMVGHNIKMLMPNAIAIKHDGYLRRYRETGVKHVVDTTRRVRAMRQDGTTFPAEIIVKEFKKTPRESIFLGFVRDVTTTIEFEKATKLNEAVSDMAEVPVIVLDKIGTIYRVNRAATAAFRCAPSDMIQHNIKQFMPQHIADQHDDYLARYQRTREKHIIDSSRRVVAVRSTGEEFPCTITVREMCDDVGNTLFYVGYLRDLTTELLAAQGMLANETVVANSPNPVISINTIGTVLSFSPAAQQSWGYSATEVVGQNIKMLMPVDIAARHDGYLQRYAKTGEKRIIDTTRDITCKRKDGSHFPAQVNVKELRRGDQTTFIGYITDLTQANRLLEQTRISKTSLDASPIPIIISQEDGTISEFNVAAERFFGYRLEEVIHKNVKVLVPPDHAERHDEYMERYRSTRVATVAGLNRSVTALHKNGHILECDLTMRECVVPDVTMEGGSRTVYIGFFVDTAGVRKLERANAVNTAVCDLCTVPMLSIDAEGTLLLYNRAAQDVFGYTPAEAMNRNIKMLMPKDIADQHDAILQRYAETGVKHVIDTTRIARGQRKDGTIFPVELKIREVSKKGVDPIFVGYARDMTEEQKLTDAKKATDAVLDRSGAPIVAIDLRGTIIRFNAAAERLFGWTASEIANKNVKVLMPHEIARKHDEYLRRYIRTGERHITAPREVMAMRKDGHVFPVELTLRQTRTGNPEAMTEDGKNKLGDVKVAADVALDTLFIGYFKDMSMTHVLRRSNEMRDVVLDNATVPMLQITDMGIITYCNPAAAEEFGWPKEELLGANIKVLTPDAIAVQHDGYLQRYRETGVKTVIDSVRRIQGKRRNGEEFPMEISVREIEIDGKRRFVGYVRNVSDELKIEDMRHMFGVVTDLSSTPLVVMNAIGTIKLVNLACCKTFGYEREELLEHNVKLLQTPEIANKHDGYLEKYRRTKVKSVIDTTRRVPAKRRDGTTFPVEITVREIVDRENGQSTYVGYLRDITDIVRAEVMDTIAMATADLSPIPLIAIDRRGIVLQFSRAAADEFGYEPSEVIGKNVKILQNPDVASQHDEYLKKYLETGEKHVIGTTRRTDARRKNGESFPVELNIVEVQVEGTEGIYIGFCRSLKDEIQQQEAFAINQETCNLLPVPFIAMNSEGRIDKINTAGLRIFGYTQEEIIGQNVKTLMPDSIAVNHDGYLARYRETNVKTVVDSFQKVMGKRKDGSLFMAQIGVKEMLDELGNKIFFGFIRDITQEAAAETEVEIGNAITSMSLIPQIVLDDVGTILKYSNSAETTFGYARSEIVGRNIKMLMPESFRKVHDSYLAAFRETRVKNVIGTTRAVPAVRKDGTEIVMKLRVSSVEHDGKCTFIGYCEDISARLRDEKEAAILHVINDFANIAVVVINEVGTIERVSRAAIGTFGYDEAELLGRNVNILMPRQIADHHDGYLNQYMRTKEKHVIDSTRRVVGKHRDGREFPIEIGVAELKIDGVSKFVGFIRDITEEVKREEETGFSDAIFALSTVPVVIADQAGRIVKCSGAITDLFGWKPEELTGANLKKLMGPEIAAHHDGYLHRYATTGVKHVVDTTRVVTGRHKNNKDFPVSITVKELKSSTGATFYAGLLERPSQAQMDREAARHHEDDHAPEVAEDHAAPRTQVEL